MAPAIIIAPASTGGRRVAFDLPFTNQVNLAPALDQDFDLNLLDVPGCPSPTGGMKALRGVTAGGRLRGGRVDRSTAREIAAG
jgi:hypothetical protein